MDQSFTFGGHSYQIVSTAMTWNEAKLYAEGLGGHLAKIESADENAAIFERASALTNVPTANDGGGAAYLWLGASDMATEGAWRWHDGSALLYANWGSGLYGSEPDNFNGSQDAMAMGLERWPSPTGGLGVASQWNDVNESNRLFSVIEWDNITGAPEPTNGTADHTLSVIVDQGIISNDAVLVKDLTEIISYVNGNIQDHTVIYNGISFNYNEIDSLITTVTRDSEFTAEFRNEIFDFAPEYADITYENAINLVGVSNIDSILLSVAGADGLFVS